MKSKVVLLPCGEYDEEKIYSLLKQGLDLLGGVEALIPKEAKNSAEAEPAQEGRGRKSSDHTSGCRGSFCTNPEREWI